jgi:hypothetical protein
VKNSKNKFKTTRTVITVNCKRKAHTMSNILLFHFFFFEFVQFSLMILPRASVDSIKEEKSLLEPLITEIGHSTKAEPSLVHSSGRVFWRKYFHDLSLEHVGMAPSQLDHLLGADISDMTVDDQAPEKRRLGGGGRRIKERPGWEKGRQTHPTRHTNISSWLKRLKPGEGLSVKPRREIKPVGGRTKDQRWQQ